MSTVADPLLMLNELPTLDAQDTQLAQLLVRRGKVAGEQGIAIWLMTLFLSRARREGHSGLTLQQLAQQATVLRDETEPVIPASLALDDAAWWRAQLTESELIGDGQPVTPVVLRDDMLQFYRYFAAEERIAIRIRLLLAQPPVNGVPCFSLVTGGPGTGKTHTVAQNLVRMVTLEPGLRVALAAPTGKAAARLTESIRQRIQSTGATAGASADVLRALMDLEASTLHRLLDYNGYGDVYRRHAGNPLPFDLVIVDEASMVDVLMLDALLAALRPGARLMLVGDHHQLSSVEAGDVLGVLCRAAESAPDASTLRDAVTRLTTSHRFKEGEGIGALATAILAGDVAEAWRLGHDDAASAVRIVGHAATPDALLSAVLKPLARCRDAESIGDLLSALESFRLLAPEREGPRGVRGLNRAVERWLARQGVAVHEPWYHGRPVLVTANDYATRVFNGDIGVVWHTGANVSVHFRSVDDRVRSIAPGRLPAVETAWAMTVHKSQGSEFDHVTVVLSNEESRVMSRELLYTAVTRARHSVTIVGSEAMLRSAIAHRTERTSGLAQRLIG